MLLNVAAEQEDNELLLQKHFTALLSAAWRMKSLTERRQNVSSSRNGLCFGGRFFSCPVNQTSCDSMKEPGRRMKFTNLGQSSKLVLAALNDANSRQQDDGVSLSDQREDAVAVITEQLNITLEFQRELVDSMISFPPLINLSIYGSDPQTSANKSAEDHHLKDSQNMAENRFRYSIATANFSEFVTFYLILGLLWSNDCVIMSRDQVTSEQLVAKKLMNQKNK